MKNYIFDNEDTYTKKCETVGCSNEVLIGASRQYCLKCLGGEKILPELECQPIPNFYQSWVM